MDTPLATSVIRALLRHTPRTPSRYHRQFHTPSSARLRYTPVRRYQDNWDNNNPRFRQASSPPLAKKKKEVPGSLSTLFVRDDIKDAQAQGEWFPKNPFLQIDMSEEMRRFPMVTAQDLARRRERPRRVKMLVRDYIDDALYNQHYGYFSKHAVIFETSSPFDFPSMRDELDFHDRLADEYTRFEDALDAANPDGPNHLRQLWHTPTELFKPYYGEAIARYLVANYKLSMYPYKDLIIYEMGAGNGTMMRNILDYIRDNEPDVYARTRYRVIEISSHLAQLQQKQVENAHVDKIEVINKSIFDWDIYVPEECFFLALEVLDNFAHDMIRYDPDTEQPLQGVVLCDRDGDMYDVYTAELDPVAERFLKLRSRVVEAPYYHPLGMPKVLRKLRAMLPGNGNLTEPEYIPTKAMLFFDVLREWFPGHKLVMSDFSELPEAVEGVNGPVVQTRYNRKTVPVTTPFVQQGYFDILFPTDFDVINDLYKALTGKLTRVMKHDDFMERWAYLEQTQTRSGENPLLTWYKNVSMLSSV
ncbi:COG1565 domain protein [Ascodesmis nigricans]|uniref:Protein arginine methyltransferase NDUFAF7 n=1 Tax=Ascodesmis nigricans TaxID=341454 RepID=A0A4S2N681_9PEZI|nr:COG1565 domain protein [Ascodesmis nigricans]